MPLLHRCTHVQMLTPQLSADQIAFKNFIQIFKISCDWSSEIFEILFWLKMSRLCCLGPISLLCLSNIHHKRSVAFDWQFRHLIRTLFCFLVTHFMMGEVIMEDQWTWNCCSLLKNRKKKPYYSAMSILEVFTSCTSKSLN